LFYQYPQGLPPHEYPLAAIIFILAAARIIIAANNSTGIAVMTMMMINTF
jgi:hypothetical protein